MTAPRTNGHDAEPLDFGEAPPTPPQGWKLAWDLNPPAPGDPDHTAYLSLLPAMIEYHDALLEASEAAGRMTWSDGSPIPDPREDPLFEDGDVDVDNIIDLLSRARWDGDSRTDEPDEHGDEAEDETWPTPMAEAAYHGVLGAIVRAAEPYTEADPVGILGTLLGMFGAACGGACRLYQGSMQRPNVSVVLVGATSIGGRKGTALDVGRSALRLAYPELETLWVVGLASGEAVTGHLERKAPEDRVLIVEPEFGRLLTIMSREGSTLSPVLRNAWDGVPLGHARARDESLVTRHHVAMLGHVTPLELRAKLTDVDAANGFANRILWLAVRRSKLVSRPESPERHVQPYVQALHEAIVEAIVDGRELAFDATAAERWDAFYAEMATRPRFGLAGAVTARHEAQVARLALVYALADMAGSIGLPHLEAAIAFADYARRSAVWALGDSTGNRHADVIRGELAERTEISFEDARKVTGLRLAADIEEAVGVLVEAHLAEIVAIPRPGGGRPRRVIRAGGANRANRANPLGGARREKDGFTT